MFEKKKSIVLQRTVIALVMFATALSGCQPTATPIPPSVALVVNPDITDVFAGDTVALTAEASGRDLRFKWSAGRGKLSALDTPAVIYTAPGTEGVDTVTVEVSSASGTTIKSKSFTVILATPIIPTPAVTHTPMLTTGPRRTPRIALPALDIFPQGSEGEDFYWANPRGDEVTHQYADSEECRRSGSYGLKLTYTMSDDTDGGWGVHWAYAPRASFDASGFSVLTFWVKGMAGGETFQIGAKDTSGKEIKVESKWFVDIKETQWRLANVSLSEFKEKGVNIASLDNVNFGFNRAHGSGQICIDDIFFQ